MDGQLEARAVPDTAVTGAAFVRTLTVHGDRPAVVTPEGFVVTYRELASRVAAVADRLGTTRRLVLLAASGDLDTLVTYLASLHGGHPVLLTDAGDRRHADALVARYDPDVLATRTSHGWQLQERRAGSAHLLHPELAMLLSTSGSTGSPKLVRLSAGNLRANAAAIASYLPIRDTDRAVLSLPMHYCYGLSVINSNLLRGAAILLTDRSVTDPEFWSFFRRHKGTSLHGVPYTFDLLDRVGFDEMHLPALRYVTQAGGKLGPDRVRRYAQLGESKGWQLFVMYGQTEATARMAYLPPDLAAAHPRAIGVPIPGGSFDLAPSGRPGEGELIYHGPNVMLGYAHAPPDLALGRTVTALSTGDIGRRTPEGLYEVIGRASRFVKLYGHRVDLEHVEQLLRDQGYDAACAGTDNAVIVAVTADHDPAPAAALVATRLGLPSQHVRGYAVRDLPRLSNGKIDYQALVRLTETTTAPTRWWQAAPRSVRQLFTATFPRTAIGDDDTFVGLGGDSLSYIPMAQALERVLGEAPQGWPTMPLRELEARRSRRRRVTPVDTDIVLRAVAIILVVGTHIGTFHLRGGAHLLLLIAGWAFARFLLVPQHRTAARIGRSAARIAVPAVLWLAWRTLVTDDVGLANVLLINNYLHQAATGYWFVEVIVQTLLVLAVVFAIPGVRRFEQRHHFTAAAVALSLALLANLLAHDTNGFPVRAFSTHGVLWLFALGWLAQRATTAGQKLTVIGIASVVIPGYFAEPGRNLVVLTGLLLLILLPRVVLPRLAARITGLVAGASLYIYLTHYALFPPLLRHLPPGMVLIGCLAGGIGAWAIAQHLPQARRLMAATARPRLAPQTTTATDGSELRDPGSVVARDKPVGARQHE